MNSINIFDYLDLFENQSIGENNMMVNLRGTNGSGKSSVPFSFINSDKDTFELTYEFEGKPRVVATVCPNERWLFLGAYKTKCGGLDYFRTQEQTADALEMLWNLPFNILLEGVISSTIFSTYADLFNKMNSDGKRNVVIATLLPPLEVCLSRVQKRNGGKEVKTEQIENKYNIMKRNLVKFRNAGFNCLQLDNSTISLEDTKNWFLSELGLNSKIECEPPSSSPNFTKNGLYLPDKKDIQHYPWFTYYKQPNDQVKVNHKNLELYWYWISERMNIWYKRVVLRQPAPWTNDPILRENSFTNAIRDLDRGTIIYLNDILKKIDEPCEDLVKRKKEIMLNTMIYRLFIRKETWDCIGFIYLDTWEEQWKLACERLRARRDSGELIFHNAYFIYTMINVSPSPDNHDKLENAINLIQSYWKPKLDDAYEFVTTHNMKDCLEYLSKFECSGGFTAYEWVCDWAMCSRHTVNTLVDWDDDNYVNVGPGNKRGIDFIFEESGNLSDVEKNIYLRATWDFYMKKFGHYDRFMEQLPPWMNGDINLRVIEHDCCEFQKYAGAIYNGKKCKKKFENKSDVDDLVL